MYIDTHCHLNFDAFVQDLDGVINRAKEAGVEKIIIPGARIDSSYKAVEISNTYPECYAAVGIHPHHCDDFTPDQQTKLLQSISELANKKRVVAIGEIGLDYHGYKDSPPLSDEIKKLQKELFTSQLAIGKERHLPVIVHCRNAQEDLMAIMKEFNTSDNDKIRGVFHCFDGDSDYLKDVLDLEFYVGFDGNITYPANNHLRELISKTPLNRLLLETDSPYLTPVPHRSSRNEPAYISIIAKTVAEIYKKPLEDIGKLTHSNAINLFHL